MLRILGVIFFLFSSVLWMYLLEAGLLLLQRFTGLRHGAIMKIGKHFSMPQSTPPEFGINSWLEDELYQQYLHDRKTVDDSWKKIFETNGSPATPTTTSGTPAVTAPLVTTGEQLVPLRGAAARIAENMNASLRIPLATSQRVIPVKVIDENRRIINEHRTLIGKPKISYTHIVGWAVVKALPTNP